MIFRTRKLIKPEDLNGRNTLFGGRLMSWIDEECAVYAVCQMNTHNIVTKYISEMNFVAPAYQGDIIEIGVETVKTGRTSLTLRCEVRNKDSKQSIITIDSLVFVAVDENGRPAEFERESESVAA
ncbi:MAG: hotdog domain-containing protein [Maricaulaceae bacterium]